MADDPLEDWRKTIAADWRRAGQLPAGPVKNLIHKKLRGMESILQAVDSLAENHSFRGRVETLARRMKETPASETAAWEGVSSEFAACVQIARAMERKRADRNAQGWPSLE